MNRKKWKLTIVLLIAGSFLCQFAAFLYAKAGDLGGAILVIVPAQATLTAAMIEIILDRKEREASKQKPKEPTAGVSKS